MTPEQKWRAEALKFLRLENVSDLPELTNHRLYSLIDIKIEQYMKDADYLLSEYIINIKHASTNQTNG